VIPTYSDGHLYQHAMISTIYLNDILKFSSAKNMFVHLVWWDKKLP